MTGEFGKSSFTRKVRAEAVCSGSEGDRERRKRRTNPDNFQRLSLEGEEVGQKLDGEDGKSRMAWV